MADQQAQNNGNLADGGDETQGVGEQGATVSGGTGNSANPKPKKSKTPAQKAREKARRKRRKLKKLSKEGPNVATSGNAVNEADALAAPSVLPEIELEALPNLSESDAPLTPEPPTLEEESLEGVQDLTGADIPMVAEEEISSGVEAIPGEELPLPEVLEPEEKSASEEDTTDLHSLRITPLESSDRPQQDNQFGDDNSGDQALEDQNFATEQFGQYSMPEPESGSELPTQQEVQANVVPEDLTEPSKEAASEDENHDFAIFEDGFPDNSPIPDSASQPLQDVVIAPGEIVTEEVVSSEISTEQADAEQKAARQQKRQETVAEEQAGEEANKAAADQLIAGFEPGEDLLDEDAKQGVLGRFFDWLSGSKKHSAQQDTVVEVTSGGGNQPPAQGNTAGNWGGFLGGALKIILTILFIVGLMFGAFWLGSQFKLMDWVNQWFNQPKPIEIKEVDQDLVRKAGFGSLWIFGKNTGSQNDQLIPAFRVVLYFGKLTTTVAPGAVTGVSAVNYYGFFRDNLHYLNRLVYYVDYLQQLRIIYTVDVYKVLDSASNRSQKMAEFLNQSKLIFQNGLNLRREMNVLLADFEVSYNTLTPEKTQTEKDFFTAIEDGFGEKASQLLENYIRISQKQVELKAKIGALTRLIDNFETVLIRLQTRITAIEQNQEALIQGIQIIEVEGANIDFILNSGSN